MVGGGCGPCGATTDACSWTGGGCGAEAGRRGAGRTQAGRQAGELSCASGKPAFPAARRSTGERIRAAKAASPAAWRVSGAWLHATCGPLHTPPGACGAGMAAAITAAPCEGLLGASEPVSHRCASAAGAARVSGEGIGIHWRRAGVSGPIGAPLRCADIAQPGSACQARRHCGDACGWCWRGASVSGRVPARARHMRQAAHQPCRPAAARHVPCAGAMHYQPLRRCQSVADLAAPSRAPALALPSSRPLAPKPCCRRRIARHLGRQRPNAGPACCTTACDGCPSSSASAPAPPCPEL